MGQRIKIHSICMRWPSDPSSTTTPMHLGCGQVQNAPKVPPVYLFSRPIWWQQSGSSVAAAMSPWKVSIGRTTGKLGEQTPVFRKSYSSLSSMP